MIDQKFMTHLPALFSALLSTTGHVLEVGAGLGSTPMIAAFCAASERYFLSVESDLEWANKCQAHHDPKYSSLASLAKDKWGVVFIDHAPEQDRVRVANLFLNSAQLIVIHDWSSADTKAHGSILTFRHSEVSDRFFPSTITLKGRG